VAHQSDRPPEPSEKDLTHRAQAGEAEAFGALYDRYAERIFRFLRRRTTDQALAEDLTSEVFLRAWDHLDGFDPNRAPFGAWLFRIARNLAIDLSRKRGPDTSIETLSPEPAELSPGPEMAAAARLDSLRLYEALADLTPPQQEVLSLRYIEGLSTAEVAAALGKRAGAVRALQMRGLRALGEGLTTINGVDDDQS
jgi:RNA polymerase sigma-70 factor (ECF subfamily)